MRFLFKRFILMSRVGLFLVCGWLVWSGAGCGKDSVAATENTERNSALYRQAFAAEQSGDIDEAIRLYNKVLIDEPKSFSAHFQLATLLHDHREDYIGAIYHYRQYMYLRPESDKSTLAQERVRIAEQLLAPQILRKVGESVQGISQAHLLKENDRLNRIITTMEGEKSVLVEEKNRAEKERVELRADNVRLREILVKMRVDETAAEPAGSLLKRAEAAARKSGEAKPPAKTDLKALREEAASISGPADKGGATRKPLVDIPSTEAVLKKVQSRLEGVPEPAEPVAQPPSAEKGKKTEKPDKSSFSALSLFGKEKEDKKEKGAKAGGEQRTYVVQPGDTLFRVAEKFYGDSTRWKIIRDANRARIDPDGRIRAGQMIVVP